jgi:hypothetical protein
VTAPKDCPAGRRPVRGAVVAALLSGLLLAISAGPAQAAVTIGSNLSGPFDPVANGHCSEVGGCAGIHYVLPERATAAPIDGVIVRWRVRGTGAMRRFVARYVAYDTVRRKGTSAAGEGVPGDAVSTFPTRLPIRAGEHAGIMLENGASISARQNDGAYLDVFVPPPSATEPTSAQGDFLDQPVEVAYNADIEPDADQDGYGDETQDLCPTSATTALPCPALPAPTRDTTAPHLLGRPRAIAFGPSRGAVVRFNLSEAGVAHLTLLRRAAGRRTGGRCLPRRRRGKRCVRYFEVGSVSRAARAGANRIPIRRQGGRPLGPGRYRLRLTVEDEARNESPPAKADFRVVGRR